MLGSTKGTADGVVQVATPAGVGFEWLIDSKHVTDSKGAQETQKTQHARFWSTPQVHGFFGINQASWPLNSSAKTEPCFLAAITGPDKPVPQHPCCRCGELQPEVGPAQG
jgi:hypothetical protein